MQPYANHSGNSGVVAYESAETTITVKFRDGDRYLYDYAHSGREKVERMKQLAEQGRGLATYINRHVRGSYARKLN